MSTNTGPDRRSELATASSANQLGASGTPERDAAETGLTPEKVSRAVALAKERLRLNPDLHDGLHMLVDRALLSEYARANELEASFDLRWKADMRAIERWRAAGPDRGLTLPDHADLCVWLSEQREVCLQWARSIAYRTEGSTSSVERAINAEAHSLLRAQRFCPHCNPCDHSGGEKCRAPSTPSADAPTREDGDETIAERAWAKGWNDALERVAKSREAMNAAAHPGAFAHAVRALKVRT